MERDLGYSSWFHGCRAEVWGVLNTVLMERDLVCSWFHGYRTQVCGVLNTVLMERDLGTV